LFSRAGLDRGVLMEICSSYNTQSSAIGRQASSTVAFRPMRSSRRAAIEYPSLDGWGVTQFSPEQATDVHIETFSRSVLSPKLC